MRQQRIPEKERAGTTGHQDGWQLAGPHAALAGQGRAVFKIAGRQIAVFETNQGLFAINNRCPHQGYPLVEGTMAKDCVLACNWHGWTFDLKSGKTIQGRDPVKTYPVERRGDDIWLDITPEPADHLKDRAYRDLAEAMAEHDYERIARSLSRLDKAGEPYEQVAARVIEHSLGWFENGIGHAHAGLADWISLAGNDPELRLGAYLEGLGHFSWDRLFSPPAPVPDHATVYSAPALRIAIEDMDQPASLALVRGAFRAGHGFAALKPVFLDVIFAHYAGFGHPAIYVMKAEELIGHLGPAVEETLALQIARYLCQAAREDLIPEFRQFGEFLRAEPGTSSLPDAAALSGQSVRSLLAMTSKASAHPYDSWETLLAASAINMLRFDDSLQHRVTQPIARNISWLDFTHAITFAEAVHHHAGQNPALWHSGLLQMACFIGRNAASLGDMAVDAMVSRWRVVDSPAFFSGHRAALFNMDDGDYIYGVHRLKMLTATERLLPLIGPKTAELLLAALNRYLSAHIRQRHPARVAYQARQAVMREG